MKYFFRQIKSWLFHVVEISKSKSRIKLYCVLKYKKVAAFKIVDRISKLQIVGLVLKRFFNCKQNCLKHFSFNWFSRSQSIHHHLAHTVLYKLLRCTRFVLLVRAVLCFQIIIVFVRERFTMSSTIDNPVECEVPL